MTDLKGQRVIEAEEAGAVALSDSIKAVVGTTATALTRPSGARMLVLQADVNGWRVRLGDFHTSGMPSVEFPAASVTDGSAGWYIAAGRTLTLPAAGVVTVKGYAGSSVLSYYWV